MPSLFDKRQNKISNLSGQLKNLLTHHLETQGVEGFSMAEQKICDEINQWNQQKPNHPIKLDDLIPFECKEVYNDNYTQAIYSTINKFNSNNFDDIKKFLPETITTPGFVPVRFAEYLKELNVRYAPEKANHLDRLQNGEENVEDLEINYSFFEDSEDYSSCEI